MNQISKFGIFTLLLSSSLTIMVGTVIAPSLKEISVHLGFEENPGLLITLPSLGVVIFAPFVGKLIDRKGAYLMLRWGLIPYALLGLLGGHLNNPYLVVIDRILLGVATASIQAAGTGLIALLFIGDDRMKMIAWQGMDIELGGVVILSALKGNGGFSHHTRYVTVGGMMSDSITLSSSILRSTDIQLSGTGLGTWRPEEIKLLIAEILPEMFQLAADGKLKIETVNIPLKNIENAWEMTIDGGKRFVVLI